MAGQGIEVRLHLRDAVSKVPLLAAVPELTEIEINPLRATTDGRLLALDVVVGGAGAGRSGADLGPAAEAGSLSGVVAVGGAPTEPPAVVPIADGARRS